MSEEKSPFFEPIFNRSVKFRARDQRLSSDGGVLLLREADERLGLVESIVSRLYDPRRQDLIRYQPEADVGLRITKPRPNAEFHLEKEHVDFKCTSADYHPGLFTVPVRRG